MMASAGILQKKTWIILPRCVAFALLIHQCCCFIVGCGPRSPTQRRPSKPPSSLAESNNANPSKERWILLVEDEDDLRSAIGKFLAKEVGYRVTGVSDARSAILVCRGIVRSDSRGTRFKFDPNFNRRTDGLGIAPMDGVGSSATNATQNFSGPDCLILDIRLGKMSGLELLKIIRSDPLLQGLPVVLLTAKGKVEDRILGYEVGADAYLPKPFDPGELLSIINGLMMGKASVSGDTGGGAVQNDNANNDAYSNLKRELKEIKSLLEELGSPERAMSWSDESDERVSLNSLHGDLLEIKKHIKQMDADDVQPPKLTAPAHQFGSMSILTPEEIEIINLVAQGMTSREVALTLKCSISKIDKRLSVMCKKAGVEKRTDLVAWWEEFKQDRAVKTNSV